MLWATARPDRAGRRAVVIFMARLTMKIGLRINRDDEKEEEMCDL